MGNELGRTKMEIFGLQAEVGKVKKAWYVDLGEDSLEIGDSEIEELENDELSVAEAGFLSGYAKEEEGYEEF